jgi:transcriptional regulator of NAD metabolism
MTNKKVNPKVKECLDKMEREGTLKEIANMTEEQHENIKVNEILKEFDSVRNIRIENGAFCIKCSTEIKQFIKQKLSEIVKEANIAGVMACKVREQKEKMKTEYFNRRCDNIIKMFKENNQRS